MIEIIKVFKLGYVHTIPQQHTATAARNWNRSFKHIAFNPLNPKIKIKFSFVAPIHLL